MATDLLINYLQWLYFLLDRCWGLKSSELTADRLQTLRFFLVSNAHKGGIGFRIEFSFKKSIGDWFALELTKNMYGIITVRYTNPYGPNLVASRKTQDFYYGAPQRLQAEAIFNDFLNLKESAQEPQTVCQ